MDRREWRFGLVTAGMFFAVALFDVVLQFGEGSNADAVFESGAGYWLRAVWVAVKQGLFFGGIALVMPRIARFLLPVVWVWVCVVEVVQVVSRAKFGISLDGDWLMIVLASSGEEMATFWGEMVRSWSVWAALLGGIAVGVAGVKGVMAVENVESVEGKGLRARDLSTRFRSAVVGVVCLLPFLWCNLVRMPLTHAFAEVMYLFVSVDTVGHAQRFFDMAHTAKAPQLPTDLKRIETPLVGVVVVGESATRNNWGLYGYERDTTPRMNAIRDELAVVSNVTATVASTGQAMRFLLTEATMESPNETKCTLAQCYRAMGAKTAVVSNQSRWGRWGGVEGLLFAGCETNIYLRSETKRRPIYDTEMLSPLEDLVSSTPDRPLVVFLHLQGSHEPFFPNYPRGWNRFGEGTMLDMYDNTILFTDYLLGEIVERLKRTGRPAFLFYTSDHGESPRSAHWRDGKSEDLLAVPCIVWRSGGKTDVRTIEGKRTDRFFRFLIELASPSNVVP